MHRVAAAAREGGPRKWPVKPLAARRGRLHYFGMCRGSYRGDRRNEDAAPAGAAVPEIVEAPAPTNGTIKQTPAISSLPREAADDREQDALVKQMRKGKKLNEL